MRPLQDADHFLAFAEPVCSLTPHCGSDNGHSYYVEDATRRSSFATASPVVSARDYLGTLSGGDLALVVSSGERIDSSFKAYVRVAGPLTD